MFDIIEKRPISLYQLIIFLNSNESLQIPKVWKKWLNKNNEKLQYFYNYLLNFIQKYFLSVGINYNS
jgi:NADH:ubiquinone oxidoreductase subunit